MFLKMRPSWSGRVARSRQWKEGRTIINTSWGRRREGVQCASFFSKMRGTRGIDLCGFGGVSQLGRGLCQAIPEVLFPGCVIMSCSVETTSCGPLNPSAWKLQTDKAEEEAASTGINVRERCGPLVQAMQTRQIRYRERASERNERTNQYGLGDRKRR